MEKAYKMERVNKIVWSISVFGVGIAALLSSLTFGLGAGWQTIYEENKLFSNDWNPLRDLGFTYFIISFCFLLLAVITRKNINLYMKTLGFLPLAVIFIQCRILILFKPDKLPDWIIAYSSWLGLLLYTDFLFLSLATLSTILHLYSSWLARSSR